MTASFVPGNAQSAKQVTSVRKLRDVLHGVGVFSQLKVDQLGVLADQLKIRTVKPGTEIIRQGDRNADAFYMIASGHCTVWIKKGKEMAKVADLGPGSYFGERALVIPEPRAATVRAETATEVFVLYTEDFKGILGKNPLIGQEFKKYIAEYEG